MMKEILAGIATAALAADCSPKYPDGLYAEMATTKGLIVLQLEYQKAPLTVMNFAGLAEGKLANKARPGKPYYDSLTFHRVVPGFVIQGGDPEGTGRGGPGYTFPDEFDPSLRHTNEGILSMANAGPGTNGSQFFITLGATPHLNDKHSIFGHVFSGMDVVTKIAQGDKMTSVKIVAVGDAAKNFKIDQEAFDNLMKKKNDEIKEKAVKADEETLKLIAQKYPNATKTASGMLYVTLAKGTGSKPKQGTMIKAHYTGWLLNGTKFDSSVDRGEPFEFQVGIGEVIAGWDEALMDMQKGEKRTLILPPSLGYGARGAGGVIPPNSWLIFDVELVGF